MLIGVCVDSNQSVNLVEGEQYYLFEHGGSAYYASRFPTKSAHFGAYQKDRFEIVKHIERNDNTQTSEPSLIDPLEQDNFYVADLIYSRGYHMKKKKYYIQPRKEETHCNFYDDPEFISFRGCFPIHWFSNYQEFTPIKSKAVTSKKEKAKPDNMESEQLSLFDF